ncbi:hypothetical protein L484_022080 [Morus notabilis]|uniref:Maternal effect embryo arrest 59 n=1 Tax=Morus notabilis TaxID=981085 RepID=W9RXG7_9ROSA|nr:hypothetical protein L484_022080 [Morus notabilis]
MERCNKMPNRSDIHLSKEEEAKIEAETREYFDGITPKRHTKPQRSEYSSKYVDAFSNTPNGFIPEFSEFQRLEKYDPQKLVYTGSKAEEEYVETEYYKDLNSIDKQHHTTGKGFIKMDNTSGKCFNLGSDSVTDCHEHSKCNPATNDWFPAPDQTANSVKNLAWFFQF